MSDEPPRARIGPVVGDLHTSMALPDPLRGSGRLFVWPQDPETKVELESLARHLGRTVDAFPEHDCLALHLEESSSLRVLDALRKTLSPLALSQTRAVFKPGLDAPNLSDFPRAESLSQFLVFARAKWLVDMMANDRVKAWFQPIVSAEAPHRLVALEALARGEEGLMRRPVAPQRLISAAREAGLMTALDRFVHEQALGGFIGRPSVSLFLNVNPRTLEDPKFSVEGLLRSAMRRGLSPDRITLEIIECESIVNLPRMQDILTEARGLGFGIALDDLGAGFSNLNLIHQLRPDVVKLDMHLTRNVASDPFKASLAAKILEATRELGVRTVAEGVEQPEELAWLHSHGVDYVQGFLIARPEPVPDTSRFAYA